MGAIRHTLMLLAIAMIVVQSVTQEMHLHDLNNNNGYVTLKLDSIKLIRNYNKVLHIINVTEFEVTKDHIKNNILSLKPKAELVGPMYGTINQSLILLESKIRNLKPHHKQKRGLIDVLGTGLKYLAGTMDHADEVEIKEKLDKLSESNGKLVKENNKQVLINKEISEQTQNVTSHIRNQQRTIEQYFNSYNTELINKATTLGEEMKLIQYLYQINHDILLFRNHVDDIEQILFSSSLGVLSKNILTTNELKLISDLQSYQNIKITVTLYRDQIIIILLIPQFSDPLYTKVLIEPIPDSENKSLFLETNTFLVDEQNVAFVFPVKGNLKKNLVPVQNDCIEGIMSSKEAYCPKQISKTEEIKEITDGIIVTKGLKDTQLEQNCNKLNVKISGNYMIKFENCKIKIQNLTFENFESKIYDKIILPNFVTKLKEEKIIQNIELEELYLKHIDNREFIEDIGTTKQKVYLDFDRNKHFHYFSCYYCNFNHNDQKGQVKNTSQYPSDFAGASI